MLSIFSPFIVAILFEAAILSFVVWFILGFFRTWRWKLLVLVSFIFSLLLAIFFIFILKTALPLGPWAYGAFLTQIVFNVTFIALYFVCSYFIHKTWRPKVFWASVLAIVLFYSLLAVYAYQVVYIPYREDCTIHSIHVPFGRSEAKLKCINDMAHASSNDKVCDNFEGGNKVFCYYSRIDEKAIENGNIELCLQSPLKETCYLNVAVATNDAELCSLLNAQDNEFDQKRQYVAISSSGDWRVDRAERGYRDQCYYDIGRRIKDVRLCENIENGNMKSGCLFTAGNKDKN